MTADIGFLVVSPGPLMLGIIAGSDQVWSLPAIIPKNIRHTIRHLLRKHQDERNKVLTIEQFAGLIAEPTQGKLTQAALIVADLPGPAIIVTRDLYQILLRRSADDVHARATA